MIMWLENLSKQTVDEAAIKLAPIVQKVQDGLTESINFAIENALDRLSGAKITITIELPATKAVAVE